MQKKTLGIVVGVIVVLGGIAAITAANKNSNNEVVSEQVNQTAANAVDNNVENVAAATTESSGLYVDYSPKILATAQDTQKTGRKVVLFFHANWCPFCKEADKNFKETLSSGGFPSNVTLIKTDYDTNNDLKKKYGVTYQHTFVQVDSNGNAITKWVSGQTPELAANIK